jgi:hypothetical protein
MPIAYRTLLLAGVVFTVAGTALSQDDVDLIDDLPKETKATAAKKAQSPPPQTSDARGKRAVSGASPRQPTPGGEAKRPCPAPT